MYIYPITNTYVFIFTHVYAYLYIVEMHNEESQAPGEVAYHRTQTHPPSSFRKQ